MLLLLLSGTVHACGEGGVAISNSANTSTHFFSVLYFCLVTVAPKFQLFCLAFMLPFLKDIVMVE